MSEAEVQEEHFQRFHDGVDDDGLAEFEREAGYPEIGDPYAAQRQEIELGKDASMTVGSWTRYLASEEVAARGELAEATTLIEAPQWPSVVRETFADLYGAPGDEPLAPSANPEGSAWVRKLVETLQRVPEWTDLKARTKGDEWACGLSVAAVARRVQDQLEDFPQKDERAAEDREATLRDLLAEAREAGGGVPTRKQAKAIDEVGKKLDDAELATIGAEQESTAFAAALGGVDAQRVIRQLATEAIGEAIGEIDAMRAAMRGLGIGSGSSAGFRVNAPRDEILELLKNDAKIRRIVALAGRLRAEAARKQATKTTYARDEVASITTGDDISRLVPSELSYLADDDLEAILFRRLHEKSALEYELRGRETLVRGPIILAIDESGSMQGVRDEWAKAAALALADVAARQRREFAVIHFDARVTRTDAFDPRKGLGLGELTNLICWFSGGGTRISTAVAEAIGIVQAAKARQATMRDADLIVISDGADYSMDGSAMIAQLREEGIALHGIGIESDFTGDLLKACSTYVRISQADFAREGAIDAVLSI